MVPLTYVPPARPGQEQATLADAIDLQWRNQKEMNRQVAEAARDEVLFGPLGPVAGGAFRIGKGLVGKLAGKLVQRQVRKEAAKAIAKKLMEEAAERTTRSAIREGATEAFERTSREGVEAGIDGAGRLADDSIRPRTEVFSDARAGWTATRPRGTHQAYEVVQRTDINWQRVRTGGDRRAIGLTNEEAARRFGLPPELDDGNFATLHHLGQDARGPLVEASTRYHGVGKPGQDILHSQYGRNQPHPTQPIDRRAFDVDDREYWRWRSDNH
jgi:hypothetical protein